MAVTVFAYGQSYKGLGLGRFNFTTDTLKMMLTTSTYTPNVDTHEFKSDVTNEITGTNYTAGGATLTGVAWTFTAASDWCDLTCSAVTWANATFTAYRGVIYKDTGVSTTSPLVSYVDFGANAAPSATTFSVTFTSGVYRVKL